MFNLSQLIAEVRPEIIDCQSHLFLTSFQAMELAKQKGLPIIVTVHGTLARRTLPLTVAQKTYVYAIGSRIFRKANLVRCLTNGDKQEIIKYGCPPDKIRIIPNAVDVNHFKPQQARRDISLFGFVLYPEKDLNTYKAVKIVVKGIKCAC
jgi:glycosyltransferase involved in cell wall biosynthesis